jgi:hypothetical protein
MCFRLVVVQCFVSIISTVPCIHLQESIVILGLSDAHANN